MVAVGLALVSALLFGALSVSLGFSMRRNTDAEAGALVTGLVAIAFPGAIALAGFEWQGNVFPFLLAGPLAPGGSQILFVLAVREAGASRTAVVAGVAPLVSVAIALVAFDEPLRAPLLIGAFLIVAGGLALAGERVRPGVPRRRPSARAGRGRPLRHARQRRPPPGDGHERATADRGRRHARRRLRPDGGLPPRHARAATAGTGAAGSRPVRASRRALGPLLRGALRGVLPSPGHGRQPARGDRVALGSALRCAPPQADGARRRHLVVGALLIVAGGTLIGAFR